MVKAFGQKAEHREPINVNLVTDGEVLARVTANAQRGEDARGFIPGVPSEA